MTRYTLLCLGFDLAEERFEMGLDVPSVGPLIYRDNESLLILKDVTDLKRFRFQRPTPE